MSNLDKHYEATKRIRDISFEIAGMAESAFGLYQIDLGRALKQISDDLSKAASDASSAFGGEIHEEYERTKKQTGFILDTLLDAATDSVK